MQTMDENSNPPENSLSLKRIAPLALIGLAAVAGFVFLRDVLSFEALAENREALLAFRDTHYVATVLWFSLAYILVVALSLPGASVLTLLGGFLFGLFPGALYIIIAATIGAAVIFLAAKSGLGDALQERLDKSSGAITRIRNGIREDEISYLLLMRLIPAVPFFAANLVPALVGVSLRNFVWTTFVGIIPGSVAFTWIGAGLSDVIARGETPSLDIIWQWYVIGPISALCLLSALPIILKRLKGRN